MTPTIRKSTSRHQRALPVTALSRYGDGAEHLAFASPCAQALVVAQRPINLPACALGRTLRRDECISHPLLDQGMGRRERLHGPAAPLELHRDRNRTHWPEE